MQCNHCEEQIPDVSSFCLKCGRPITQTSTQPLQKKSKSGVWLLVSIGVFLLVGAAVAGIFSRDKPRSPIKPNSFIGQLVGDPTATPKPTPYWVSESKKLGQEAVAIGPGKIYSLPFDVDSSWHDATFKGRFVAQGGSGNDVQVIITDEDGVENFKNSHQFRAWYNSGKITSDTLDVQLPPGKKFLIVSNSFSYFAHKSVTMNFHLNYQWLKQP